MEADLSTVDVILIDDEPCRVIGSFPSSIDLLLMGMQHAS